MSEWSVKHDQPGVAILLDGEVVAVFYPGQPSEVVSAHVRLMNGMEGSGSTESTEPPSMVYLHASMDEHLDRVKVLSGRPIDRRGVWKKVVVASPVEDPVDRLRRSALEKLTEAEISALGLKV